MRSDRALTPGSIVKNANRGALRASAAGVIERARGFTWKSGREWKDEKREGELFSRVTEMVIESCRSKDRVTLRSPRDTKEIQGDARARTHAKCR